MKGKIFSGFSKFVVIFVITAIIAASIAGVYVFRKREVAQNPSESAGKTETIPRAPSQLSAEITESKSVLLQWVDNSDNEDGFEIERKTDDGAFVKIGEAPFNKTFYADNSVRIGVTYRYRVRAFNKNGNSPYSNEVFVTIPKEVISFQMNKTFPFQKLTEQENITPKIPQYPLPLKPSEICNYSAFLNKIHLDEDAKKALLKKGFVVIDPPKEIADKELSLYIASGGLLKGENDFFPFYSALEEKDVPIYITPDTLLHYYHILFDVMLMNMESGVFYDYVWNISKQLLSDSMDEYKNATSADLKEAAKRNVEFLSVALNLLKPKNGQFQSDKNPEQSGSPKEYLFDTPSFVKDTVDKELNLISTHKGWAFSPIFIYKEDYSQYVPRGHYTRSEKLKNYFKALMWYGRMTFLIKGSSDNPKGKSQCGKNGIISEYDAKIQTLQASLITYDFLKNPNVQKEWSTMYAITSFMMGVSDDLGPVEYANVLKDTLDGKINPENIDKNYSEIERKLMNIPYNPKIYSGLGECTLMMPCPPLTDKQLQQLKVQAKTLLSNTKGFRVMGQRFAIDSYLFSKLVSPYTGVYTGKKTPLPTNKQPFTFTWNGPFSDKGEIRPFTWVKTDVEGCNGREVRGFPRGLDLMALLGSNRAKEILKKEGDTDYSDYEDEFEKLKKYTDSLSIDEWHKTLYMNWLYALKALLVPYEKGYQTFMNSPAWQDRELNTALASWAELKHDTVLYTKQSYAMAEKGGGEKPPLRPCSGYVEPVPEFYLRLMNVTEMTVEGLKKLIPEDSAASDNVIFPLQTLEDYIEDLKDISEKEVENEELDSYGYEFIKHFADYLADLLMHVLEGQKLNTNVFKTSMIADVHTDGNTKMTLEEATGNLKMIIVAFKIPDGRIVLGAGPVMSYYEFKQPIAHRLTDEEWRKMLDGKHPPVPSWTKSFYLKNGH